VLFRSPANWVAEELRSKIVIKDVSSSSNVLLLTYTDHSRQRGLDMLNSLVKNYNYDVEEFKRLDNMKTMSFVDNRISMIMSDLKIVESELQEFKKKNEMTILETDVTLYGETFREVQTSIIEAELQAHQINLLDDFLKDPESKNKAIPSIFSVDEGEKGVISQYNKALIVRERILLTSNENNFMYIASNNDVEILRNGVIMMIENAKKGISKTLADLKAKEKQLMAKFRAVPENEREYINFVRDQEILIVIYLLMLQKREEAILALGKPTDRARIIEPPYIKKRPIGPRKLYAGISIIFLTIVVPVGFLFAKDLLVSIKEEYKRNSG
jgi:uncharacterized protein involved in exopolysaccharide biosynthesis